MSLVVRGGRIQSTVIRRFAILLSISHVGALKMIVALFVGFRIAYSVFGFFFPSAVPLSSSLPPEVAPYIHLHDTGISAKLLGIWQRWDAGWFEKIATVNYLPFDRAVAFPPLYPALMHLVGRVLDNNFALAGLLISGLSFIFAMFGLYLLVAEEWDEQVAKRTIVYLSIFPTAFYLFAPYAEAIFLALVVWTFFFARRGRWGWVLVLSSCAAVTRSPGVLLAVPLAWEMLSQWRNGRRSWLALVVPASPPVSFLVFIGFSRLITGWSYFQSIATWQTTQPPLWTAIATSWRFILATGNPVEALNLGLLLAAFAVLIIGMKRIPFIYTLYVASQLLLIGSRYNPFTPLMSSARYLLVVFPLFIVLAIVLRSRFAQLVWLSISVSLLILLFSLFLVGGFVA